MRALCNFPKGIHRQSLRSRLIGAAVLAVSTPALAQTWDGGGSTSNFSDRFNWSADLLPASNAKIIFAGDVRLAPLADSAWTFNSLNFDSTAGAFVIGGSTLTLGNGGITNNSANTQTLNNALVLSAPQKWNLAAGSLVINGDVTSAGLTVDGSGNATFAGRFTSTSYLTKTGSGKLTLASSSADTISGTTTVSGGTLTLIGPHLLSRLQIDNVPGAATEIDGEVRTAGLSGGGDSGGGLVLTNGNLTINGTYPTNLSFSGAITGAGGLVKSGTSTQVLTGSQANTYTGKTTLKDGVLILRKSAGVQAIGGDMAIDGGSLQIGAAEQIANSATVTLSGGTLQLGADETLGALAGTGGTVSFSSPAVTLTAGGNDASTTFAGQFQNNGRLTKTGTGTFTLSGSSTGTLQTTINAGTLRLTSATALGSKAAVTLAGGSALEIDSAASVSLGSLAGDGNVSLKGGSLSLGGDNSSTNFHGTLSGAGSLIKVGTGTLTLGNTNTYTGGTTVSAGTLTVAATDGLGAGPLTLAGGTLRLANTITFDRPITVNGGNLEVLSTYAATLNGNLTGSGTLTKQGLGTLILAGTHTQAGGLTIEAGTVEAASDASLGASTAPLTLTGGTLRLTDTLDLARSLSVSSDGALEIADAKTVTLSGYTTFSGAKRGSGTLQLNGSGSFAGSIRAGKVLVTRPYAFGAIDLADDPSATLEFDSLDASLADLTGGGSSGGNVLLNGGTLTVRNPRNSTYAGAITGAGTLLKTGAGTLTLSGPNTYTGGTRLDGGALEAAADNNLGDPSGSLTFNGGTLRIAGTSFSQTNRSINWSGNGGGFDIAAPGHAFTVTQSLSGNGSLRKAGAGTLVLAARNTYRGGTFIDGGTLRLAAPDAIGSASAVTLASEPGTLLDLNDRSLTIASLSGGGPTGGNVNLGSATLTLAGNITSTFAGSITGTGSLAKTGSGALTLSGANTYTGGTTIAGGILAISADNNLGDPAAPLDFRGGTLRVTANTTSSRNGTFTAAPATFDVAAAQTLTLAGQFAGTGSLIKTGSGTLILSGANTYTGGITLSAGTLQGTTAAIQGNIVNNGALVFEQDFNGLCAGALSGTGSLTKKGPGTVDLTGPTTYTGPTTISAGILRVTGDNSLAGSSSVTLANTAGTALHINAGSASLASLAGGGATGGNLVLTDAILTIGSANQATAFSGAISGNGSLIKTGTAPLTLNGLNTYTGATTINDGTLILAGGNAIGDQSAVYLADSASVLLDLGGASETIGALAGGGPAGGNVKLGAGRLTVGGNNASTTYAGAITGTGGLTKTGSGTLRLDGSNTYTGGTRLASGAIEVSSESHLGSATSELSFDGGILRVTGTTFKTLARNFTWSNQGGGFDIAESTHTFSLAQPLSGTGGLSKLGPGSLVLNGYNTYTGPTRIDGGTLQLTQGMIAPGQPITIAAGAELVTSKLVSRPIAGRGKITANGLLMLGDASSPSGFHFDGTLNVGSNTIILLDADAAKLGSSTLLSSGARLSSLNGILLDAASTLRADGPATLDSPFTNKGTVESTATLTLNGNWTNQGAIHSTAVVNNAIFRHLSGSADLGNLTGDGILTIAAGQKLSASHIDQTRLTLGQNAALTLTPGGTTASRFSSLLLDAGATLDLTDNYLIVEATPGTRETVLAQITGWIASARGSGTNLWKGPGITSSLAASNRLTGLSAILNTAATTFHGVPVDANSILITHSWTGDLTGDGVINASDYFIIDSAFIRGTGGYANGDFNNDGVIDASDYFIIDSAFITQNVPAASFAAPVPEPAALLPLAALIPLLSPRRRLRRHR